MNHHLYADHNTIYRSKRDVDIVAVWHTQLRDRNLFIGNFFPTASCNCPNPHTRWSATQARENGGKERRNQTNSRVFSIIYICIIALLPIHRSLLRSPYCQFCYPRPPSTIHTTKCLIFTRILYQHPYVAN